LTFESALIKKLLDVRTAGIVAARLERKL
jgi:hypothetical protein